MRVARVKVSKLFGIFDHDIEFKLSEQITIIHGPNGYGKTIILRMIAGLLSGSFSIFHTVPFLRFELHLDDGSKVLVLREKLHSGSKSSKDGKPAISGTLVDPNGAEHTIKLTRSRFSAKQRTYLDRMLPGWMRNVGDKWIDGRTNRILTDEQLLDEFSGYLQVHIPQFMSTLDDNPLRKLQSQIHVHLIGTERLEKRNSFLEAERMAVEYSTMIRDNDIVTVEEYSRDLVARISALLALYAGRASELDRTFPARLLTEMQAGIHANVRLRERLAEIEQQRILLMDLGILDEKGGLSQIPDELYETATDVLTVYVRDTEEKLSTFKEIATKIGLFTKIINDRFTHKRLRINREKGFVFEADLGELPVSALSSGEQHEVVLLYELLFKVNQTWLVMLDEPEISLHVGWQERFLADLMDIVKLSNVDVLIATHSPIVIGEHWDLTVALKAPRNAE